MTSDHRPATTDQRPPTTDQRPTTSNRRSIKPPLHVPRPVLLEHEEIVRVLVLAAPVFAPVAVVAPPVAGEAFGAMQARERVTPSPPPHRGGASAATLHLHGFGCFEQAEYGGCPVACSYGQLFGV